MSKTKSVKADFAQLELNLVGALATTRELQSHFLRYETSEAAQSSTSESPSPQVSTADPLLPDVPLKDQLEFTPKPEPLGGAHAARLVSAARAESIAARQDVEKDTVDD